MIKVPEKAENAYRELMEDQVKQMPFVVEGIAPELRELMRMFFLLGWKARDKEEK